MFRPLRFCCTAAAGVALCALSANAAGVAASVTTSPVAFTAATTNTTDIGFNGILSNGTTFQGFTAVVVQGVTFTAQSGSAPVNVTSAGYYFPTVYPADFLTDGSNSNANNTLNVTLASPVYALALDYGSIESGSSGTGVLTFSNGFVHNLSAIPSLGSTAFSGWCSPRRSPAFPTSSRGELCSPGPAAKHSRPPVAQAHRTPPSGASSIPRSPEHRPHLRGPD